MRTANRCRPASKGPTCVASQPSTAGSWEMVTAPDRSDSTAPSSRSASAAASSRPDPSSSPSCAANETTPPATAKTTGWIYSRAS